MANIDNIFTHQNLPMVLRQQLFTLIKDIRFWIILFFILHLTAITLPPLEPGSTWRQTDGLMVARNFFEHNPNILYPTVDVAGEKTGIVGCEFPILNYLIYLVSLIFGYHSWYGRLINLIVSSIGIFYFFKLIKNYLGQEAAFNSSIIVLSSIWFIYNRTNIPDTFALSLCMIGLYYGIKYLSGERGKHLFLFFLFALIGCLSKISAASILTVLAVPYFSMPGKWKVKGFLFFFSAAILGGVCLWYFYWVPYLNQKYEFGGHFFMGMPMIDGIKLLWSDMPLTLKRFYDTPFKYVGFCTFLIGLYLVIKKKQWLHFIIFFIPFLVYLLIILKVAIGLHVDAYYVIMFIPPMAFIMGWGLTQFNKKIITYLILLSIGIEGIANQIHVFNIRPPFNSLEKLEIAVNSVSKENDLIAINGIGGGDPTPMYMAHRKGWVNNTETLSNPEYLRSIRDKGCKYLVFVKKVYGNATIDFNKVYDSEEFAIYDLTSTVSIK